MESSEKSSCSWNEINQKTVEIFELKNVLEI